MNIANISVMGIEGALRGMRQPMNSINKGDTEIIRGDKDGIEIVVGPSDMNLAKRLAKEGTSNRKFLRMIHVQMDITAMQPWWSEFDTYKIGTTRNSSSKMHRIHVRELTTADFTDTAILEIEYAMYAYAKVLKACNRLREDYLRTGDKMYWRALIELLPEGYNLTATVDLNYETLSTMYHQRRNHKLTEWHEFCEMIEALPLSVLITGEEKERA